MIVKKTLSLNVYTFLLLFFALAAMRDCYAQEVQWASEVLDFSSEYRDAKYTKEFRAIQVLGRPNKLPQFGSSFCAWSPATRGDSLGEWIKVGFRNPMRVRQIAVAESFNEGTVEKVYLFDEQDRSYKVYENNRIDTIPALGRMLNIFVSHTPYKVKALKLVLNTARIRGWNHIDAIGISESTTPIKAEINVSPHLSADLKKENLGSAINTRAEEISPVISPDGRTLYFTRAPHPQNIGRAEAQDVWYSVLDTNNLWAKAMNIGPPINNDDHNSSFSVTPDGNTMLLNNVYLPNGKMKRGLSITHKTETGWEFPREVKITDYYNDSEYSEFSLAQNGMVLIMAVQRKDTYGRKDLYASFLKPDNTWSEPRNLGAVVNSAEDETSPFLASDGVSLYYSTAGFSGYGNNDMFVTKRLDDTWLNWSEPQNLGPQLNTPEWDAYFSIPASGEYAYFVSASNSFGEGDIFRVRLSPEVRPDPVVLVRGNVFDANTKKPLSADLVYSLVNASPASQTAATASAGRASVQAPGNYPDNRAATRPSPSQASLTRWQASIAKQTRSVDASPIADLSGSMEPSGKASTNPVTGEYQIVLPLKKEYNLLASASGYLPAVETIDLTQYTEYKEIRKDLYLTPIEVGQKFTLSSIAFEQSKYELLDSSIPELERITQMMRLNPHMEIQLEGHTDNQGDWSKNLKLSEDRVKEVRKYLVEHGIEENRIQYKAYGSTQPVASNLNENSRRLNRRVEFVILKK